MRARGHRDPRIDGNGAVHLAIKRQTRGYHKTDPNVKHQKALPIRVYEQLHNQAVNDLDRAIAFLLSGALFFAMRSCEYSATSRATEQQTKTISVQNIRFYKHKRILHHQSKHLSQADAVALTFEDQKNGKKFDTVTMHCTSHCFLCPVKSWAFTVQRLRAYPSFCPTWTVDTWVENGVRTRIKSTAVLLKIRSAVRWWGPDNLGFLETEVGTHSNRSSTAMLMYLNNIPVYTIMLVGRWSSEAFLLYIRKQVLSFTRGISNKMLLTEDFYTIPDEQNTSTEDPRRPHDVNAFATVHGAQPARHMRVVAPAITVWH